MTTTLYNTACGDPAQDHCPTCTALMHLCDKCERELDAAAAAPSPRVSEQADERALLQRLVTALDGKRAAGVAGEPGFEFNDELWALLEPARAVITRQAAPAAPNEQQHVLPPTRGTGSQPDASASVLTNEWIVALKANIGNRYNSVHHMSDSGACEFARAIESELARRGRAQGGNTSNEAPACNAVWAKEICNQGYPIERCTSCGTYKGNPCRRASQVATTASASGEVLPCPFCGSTPKPYSFRGGQGRDLFSVNCDANVCPTSTAFCAENEIKAVATWNRRAPAPSREPAPLTNLYQLADNLYEAGYKDRKHECDYDPRARAEWQAVIDAAHQGTTPTTPPESTP